MNDRLELSKRLCCRFVLRYTDNVEPNSFRQRSALAYSTTMSSIHANQWKDEPTDGDDIPEFNTESRGDMSGQVLVAFFVTV